MENKDKPTSMDDEQIILQEKRTFEKAIKKLTDDKNVLLAEIEVAENELKTVDSKIHQSEQLIEQLDDITQKASYFSDANQLKSIQVKDAESLANTFNVLGRNAQKKKKELWSQITTWHSTQSQKKDSIGQIIDDHKNEVASIDQEINKRRKNFEQYIFDNFEDKAGKKRAKNVLDASSKDKKILNSFNAPITLKIKTPSKQTYEIPFIFSFKKEGKTWKYIGKNKPAYDKKIIRSVSMEFAKNKLTINEDFILKWTVKFSPYELSTSKSKNNSNSIGFEVSGNTSETESNTDKNEYHFEGGGKLDIGILELGGNSDYTSGDEKTISKTNELGTSIKGDVSNGNQQGKSSSQKFDVSSEGTIHYSLAYLDNGEISIKASGHHDKQQVVKGSTYFIKIEDKAFTSKFN